MSHDLESLLRDDAHRMRRPAPAGLVARVRDSVGRAHPTPSSRWPVSIGLAALATAAVVTVLVLLRAEPEPSAPPAAPVPSAQAWLDLDGAPAEPIRRSEDLLLREVVLLRTDAENAIDYVLERIPERVRPLVLIDRML